MIFFPSDDGIKETVLWSNSDVTVTWSPQDVSLSDSYTNYDFIKVEYCQSSSSAGQALVYNVIATTEMIGNSANGSDTNRFCMTCTVIGSDNLEYSRNVYAQTNGTIRLGVCRKYDDGSIANNICIPKRIIGMNLT